MSQPSKALLTAAGIQAMQAQRRVHELNPNAVRDTRRLSEATGLSQFGAHVITLNDGHDSTEYHRHLYEEDAVYVLSGHCVATIDQQPYPIGPGDFLGFAARGPAHVITHKGNDALVLLVFGQRLEHDVCDYPRRAKRLFITGNLEVYTPL